MYAISSQYLLRKSVIMNSSLYNIQIYFDIFIIYMRLSFVNIYIKFYFLFQFLLKINTFKSTKKIFFHFFSFLCGKCAQKRLVGPISRRRFCELGVGLVMLRSINLTYALHILHLPTANFTSAKHILHLRFAVGGSIAEFIRQEAA